MNDHDRPDLLAEADHIRKAQREQPEPPARHEMSLSERLRYSYSTGEPPFITLPLDVVKEAASVLDAAEAWAKMELALQAAVDAGRSAESVYDTETAYMQARDRLLAAHGPSQAHETGKHSPPTIIGEYEE